MKKQVLVGVGLFAGGLLMGRAWAAQEHMQAALIALETAENQLGKATPDKGGHRTKAIELIQAAKAQVRLGMRFDRRH